jgi:rhodanese-related sulfurtransferase
MQRVSPRQAHELMEREGYLYLDVRSVEEFEAGHPAGAYNIPLLTLGPQGMQENPHFLREVRAAFRPEQKLVLGCKAGVRSLKAVELLSEGGFSQVLEQRAGMDGVTDPFGRVKEKGWRAEGLALAVHAEEGRSHAELKLLVGPQP